VTTNDPTALQPEVEPVVIEGAATRSRSSRVINLALGAALAIAVAGVAFAVGRGTAPTVPANPFIPGQGGTIGGGPGPNGGGQGGPAFGGSGGLSIEGEVTAVDADSITIETPSGATIELSTNDSTAYHRQATAASSDVATGSTVIVKVDGFVGRGGQGGGAAASPAPSGAPSGATATDVTLVP
jgi:hypothetical protein